MGFEGELAGLSKPSTARSKGLRRNRLAQTLDKSRDLTRRFLRTLIPGCPLNQFHDGAADHCRIREAANLRNVLRVRDAEPHGDRQLAPTAYALNLPCRIGSNLLLLTRNACARDGIDKTLAV